MQVHKNNLTPMHNLANEYRSLADILYRSGDVIAASAFHTQALKLEAGVKEDLMGQVLLGNLTGDRRLEVRTSI
jgi:hypothetical protein